MKVEFLDSGREPRCKPDPDYPRGKYIDLAECAPHSCEAKLPYPAPRCGAMVIECEACGYRVALTVAGRPDDPHTVRIPCQVARGTIQ